MKHIPNTPSNPQKSMHFANYEVLQNDFDKKHRQKALQKAALLGNDEHFEVRIVYLNESAQEDYVETIIIMMGNDYIEIVGGIDIPINCILRVE